MTTDNNRVAELERKLAATEKRRVEDAKRAAISLALARAQVKDPNAVYETIASQVVQDSSGNWVAGENGIAKIGPDAGATYSIDRLVADVAGTDGKSAAIPSREVRDNPFAKGEHFNLTRGMEIFRQDESLGRELMASAGYHMDFRR